MGKRKIAGGGKGGTADADKKISEEAPTASPIGNHWKIVMGTNEVPQRDYLKSYIHMMFLAKLFSEHLTVGHAKSYNTLFNILKVFNSLRHLENMLISFLTEIKKPARKKLVSYYVTML